MIRFLDNDVVLGNLFIKVIERKMDSITFNKIYDFVYYASTKLNEEENTTILVSKDGILNFVEFYRDYIEIDETEEERIVIRRKEVLNFFKRRYEDYGKEYAASFEYALQQIAA